MDGRRFGSIVHMSEAGEVQKTGGGRSIACGRPRAKRSVQLVAQVNWRNSERRSVRLWESG
jgi:hypothetical protein